MISFSSSTKRVVENEFLFEVEEKVRIVDCPEGVSENPEVLQGVEAIIFARSRTSDGKSNQYLLYTGGSLRWTEDMLEKLVPIELIEHEKRLKESFQLQEIHEFINEELTSDESEWFTNPEEFLAEANYAQWFNLLDLHNRICKFNWSRKAMIAASKSMSNLR